MLRESPPEKLRSRTPVVVTRALQSPHRPSFTLGLSLPIRLREVRIGLFALFAAREPHLQRAEANARQSCGSAGEVAILNRGSDAPANRGGEFRRATLALSRQCAHRRPCFRLKAATMLEINAGLFCRVIV